MSDESKTKDELLRELREARREIAGVRGMVDNARDNILRYDREYRHVFCNRIVWERTGLTPEQGLGKTHREVGYPPDLCELWENAIQSVFDSGESTELECEVGVPGGMIWLDLHLHPEFSPNGEVETVLAVSRDITDRKHMEQALRAGEERFRRLTELNPSAMYLTDANGKCTYVNERWAQLAGVPAEEAIGRPWYQQLHPENIDAAKAGWRASVDSEGLQGFEARFVDKSGSATWILGRARPLHGDEGEIQGYLGINVDLTERKRAEEERSRLEAQVQYTQKLESLGILAGGIAHDFNSLLVGILGNADLALLEMPDTAPLRPSIAHIKVAAQRAAQLTAQMLAYSGRAHRTVEDHDLNTLVEEMRTLLETAVSKSVCLEVDLARPLPGVRADSAQLQQVVMNLVVNASEALGEEGGVVSIRTSATGDDYGEGVRDADGHDVAPGRYIVLEVSDSGAGIDEETQARIFEPFFSTKFIGRGLGLAATHGIVRGHGGTILLDSTPSEGSSFKVLLPALDRVVVPGTVSVDAPAGWKGSGTALVIDDEEIVRVVAGRALESLGLDVVTACDGLEGVEVLRERQHEITCVLLDLKMPRMDGREAFEHLRSIRDDLPILIMSGYDEQETRAMFGDADLSGFVQKPFRRAQLARFLRNVLGEA